MGPLEVAILLVWVIIIIAIVKAVMAAHKRL